MESLKLFLVASLIPLVFTKEISGQTTSQKSDLDQDKISQLHQAKEKLKKGKRTEFVLSYDFTVPGKTSRIQFIALVPKTIPNRQKITDVKYSLKPSKLFSKNGNKYVVFFFKSPPKHFKIDITVEAELFKYDLSTASKKRNPEFVNDSDMGEFLKDERYIEKNDRQIQQIAKNIKASSQIKRVKGIYDHVVDNMGYIFREKDYGALEAIKQKRGDCSEYSDLFAALCRANDIPARVITGYTTQFKDVSKHAWVEIYLERYGWVPFDPTRGDQENPLVREKSFKSLGNIYVYLTSLRNDDILDGYRYSKYKYWGDKIVFKDSITFKVK